MESGADRSDGQRVRRRTFLIDRKFQFKWTLIIVLVGVVVSAGLGYFIVRQNLENTALLDLDATFAGQVADFDAMAIYYLIGFVLVMALCLFTWGIFMTHRVAGPIFIISRYLGQLASGEIPKPRPLRKGDELKGFFDTFSAMLNSLRERNVAEAALLTKAAAALKDAGGDQETIAAMEKMATDKKVWEEDQTD
jgi:hypothetical protein